MTDEPGFFARIDEIQNRKPVKLFATMDDLLDTEEEDHVA